MPNDAEWRELARAFIDRVDRDQHAYIDHVAAIAARLRDRYDRLPARNISHAQVIEVERVWRSIPITPCTVDQFIERQRKRLHIRDARVASGNLASLEGPLGNSEEPAVVLCYIMLTIDRQGYRIETPSIAYVSLSAIALWFQRNARGRPDGQLIADIAALLDVARPTQDMLGDTVDITLSDGTWRAFAATINEPETEPVVGWAIESWIERSDLRKEAQHATHPDPANCR